jgi:orotate phosphoribosyltransferase
MTQDDVLALFREAGAILEGHFILSSGLRSPVFLQKARVFMHPDNLAGPWRSHSGLRDGAPSRRAGDVGGARGRPVPSAPL